MQEQHGAHWAAPASAQSLGRGKPTELGWFVPTSFNEDWAGGQQGKFQPGIWRDGNRNSRLILEIISTFHTHFKFSTLDRPVLKCRFCGRKLFYAYFQ